MYKLTYESDDEQLVGDLSHKHKYKSTDVKRSRSMATKDPTVVPDYLSSNEDMKYRADSSASVIMSAYPAPSAEKNSKAEKSSKEPAKSSKLRKKVFPRKESPPRYNLFNEPDEKKPAFTFSMCRQVLLCLYLIVLSASLVLCFILLQSNYKITQQLRSRVIRMETTFNDEVINFDGKFKQISTKQAMMAAAKSAEPSDQLASDIQQMQLQLEVQRKVTEVEIKKTRKIEDKLKELEGKVDKLNTSSIENTDGVRSIRKKEQDVEELLLTEFNNNKKPPPNRY